MLNIRFTPVVIHSDGAALLSISPSSVRGSALRVFWLRPISGMFRPDRNGPSDLCNNPGELRRHSTLMETHCSRTSLIRITLGVALFIALSGCANWQEEAGVENHWRSDEVPDWQAGKTTAEDVMAFLGPPSQIVNLDRQLVYYYMKESISGSGYFLVLYNRSASEKRYDRAIFFFDMDGVLTRFSYSKESIGYDE
jgi:hypothetical protein